MTQVRKQIDDDKKKIDEGEIGGEDRNVGELHRLQKEHSHSRPLKDRFGDDRKGDDFPELQRHDRNHRKRSVPENVRDQIAVLERVSGTRAPESIRGVLGSPVRFTDVIDPKDMMTYVMGKAANR